MQSLPMAQSPSKMIWIHFKDPDMFLSCFCNIRMRDSKTVHQIRVICSYKVGSTHGLILLKVGFLVSSSFNCFN